MRYGISRKLAFGGLGLIQSISLGGLRNNRWIAILIMTINAKIKSIEVNLVKRLVEISIRVKSLLIVLKALELTQKPLTIKKTIKLLTQPTKYYR